MGMDIKKYVKLTKKNTLEIISVEVGICTVYSLHIYQLTLLIVLTNLIILYSISTRVIN